MFSSVWGSVEKSGVENIGLEGNFNQYHAIGTKSMLELLWKTEQNLWNLLKISKSYQNSNFNVTVGCFRIYLYLYKTMQSAAVPDALFPSRVWVQPRGHANIVILLSPGWVGPAPYQPAALHQTSPLWLPPLTHGHSWPAAAPPVRVKTWSRGEINGREHENESLKT